MRTFLISLLVVLTAPAFAVAQKPPKRDPDRQPATSVEEQEALAQKRAAMQRGEDADVDEYRKEMEAKGKYDKPASPPLSRYAKVVAAPRPRRVAPGDSAVLRVAVIFQGGVAIPADSYFAVSVVGDPGPLSFGPAELSDPRPGEAAGVRGLMVYEDNAMFSIPFSVASGTPYRSYHVQMQLEADLVQANNGAPISRCKMACSAMVEVGDPLPVLNMRRGNDGVKTVAAATPRRQDPPAESTEDPRPVATDEPTEPGDIAGRMLSGEASEGPADRSDVEPVVPEANEGGGPPLMLLGGAAVLVLLLGALLFGRRR